MNESDTVFYEVCVYVEQKAYLALHFLFFKPTTTSRRTMWQKSWIDLTPAEVLLSLRYLPLLSLSFSLASYIYNSTKSSGHKKNQQHAVSCRWKRTTKEKSKLSGCPTTRSFILLVVRNKFTV